MERVKWPSGLAMAIGIWLIIAPFVLGMTASEVVTNHVVSGLLIAVLAAAVFFGRVHTWADWGLVLLGGWVSVSPVLYDYAGQSFASYHDMGLGLALVAFAVIDMLLVRTLSTSEHWTPTFVSAEPTDRDRYRDDGL